MEGWCLLDGRFEGRGRKKKGGRGDIDIEWRSI